ncbi:MAG TPA: hypothetical protein VFT43_10415 [Candidatus Polarisedimenticolia bacterium]|nr:hypothetical protein [Candidatus Polarisedimenticolia bacterium]
MSSGTPGMVRLLLLPLVATLVIYPFMARLILRGRHGRAAAVVLLWAALLSGLVIAYAARHPGTAGGLILGGPAYRDEMFGFLRSGVGREGDPRAFVPQHLLHLGLFVILSVASAGFLGLALGAILVGYMSYYVGALAAAGGGCARAFLLGWPPYALLRVTGYVLLGVALARPLLFAAARRPRAPFVRWRAWYAFAGALLLADLLLKSLLAPAWADLLAPCLPAGLPHP